MNMKAKIKSTGEIVEVKSCKEPLRVSMMAYEDENGYKYLSSQLEFEKEPDWEQMRHEMAKDFTATLLGRLNYDPFTNNVCCCNSNCESVNPYSHVARIAVDAADAVIEELKKPKNQENDV